MTVIVGIRTKDALHLGADSASTNGWDLTVLSPDNPKVYEVGPFLIGSTGYSRMRDLLHFSFQPPEPPADSGDLRRYMSTNFVTALRDCLKGGGLAEKENEQESSTGSLVVGVRGRLFKIDSKYAVTEVDDYTAVGCGAPFALGSLYSTSTFVSQEARLVRALEAAERLSAGVRRPFLILSQRTGDEQCVTTLNAITT